MIRRMRPGQGAAAPQIADGCFRRMFLTDAILNGLPPHIAQVIAGPRDINVTLCYKAPYPDEAIQAHLAFLARRRALRPTEEYRAPTDAEWEEFLATLNAANSPPASAAAPSAPPASTSTPACATPCTGPTPPSGPASPRSADNLIARIAEAERKGWLGETEGLKISLAGAEDKLAQIDRHPGAATVDLGMPILPPQH